MKQRLKRPLAFLLALALLVAPAMAWQVEGSYSEGLALAQSNGKWGYVNPSGTLAIPLRFEEAEPFSLGFAVVKENGRYGLLRQDGAWLLEPKYLTLRSLGYGVYLANGSTVLSAVPFRNADGVLTQVLLENVRLVSYGIPHLVLPQEPLPDEPDPQPSAEAESTGEDASEAPEPTPPPPPPTLPLDALPRLLQENNVPGWAFPLQPGQDAKFSDVNGRDWFDLWVDLSYNLGLMEGPGDGRFWPYRTLTVGEALKLAAVLDSLQRGTSFRSGGNPWYQNAVDYCLAQNIIAPDTFDDYTRTITRAELALVFAATAPMEHAADLNDPYRVQSAIPDVAPGSFAADAIYALYAKGIVGGSDKQLTFRPNAVITRSEVAAIVARLARPEQRLSLWADSSSYSRGISEVP